MKLAMKSGTPEYDAYHDLWEFHKAFGVPEHDDDYWTEVMNQYNTLRDKYSDTDMGRIVAGHLWSLMELWHNKMRGGKKNEQ